MLAALCPRRGMAVIHNSGGVQCRSLQSPTGRRHLPPSRVEGWPTSRPTPAMQSFSSTAIQPRNIMPHCEGLGRLIACDLIGMGDSDKLENSGAGRYTYVDHRDYLFALWDQIGLGDKVIMVLHDWGSALGFDWAMRNRDRVQGIVYMEAIITPLTWADWPENARRAFQGFRSESGERMILEQNMFVERVLPASIIRRLSEEEMAAYRNPFVSPGEDRRPTLTWPRMIPIEGKPAEMVKVVENYAARLAETDVPKLFINALRSGSARHGKVPADSDERAAEVPR